MLASLPMQGRMLLAEALDSEVAQYALSCATENVKECTQAFLENRRPRFRDR